MRVCLCGTTPIHHPAVVLDPMTPRTQGDEAHKTLNMASLVVFPDFMTFNGPLAANSATDLAGTSCGGVGSAAQAIPDGTVDAASDIRSPRTGGNQFDAQDAHAHTHRPQS